MDAVTSESPVLVGGVAARLGAPPGETRAILHVIAPGAVGGAESVVRVLAGAQKARGARVAVAAVVRAGGAASPFLDGLRDDGIETHAVEVGGRAYLRERRAVAAICEELAPQVLHSHGYRADIVDALYMHRRGQAIVSTVHGFTGGNLRNRAYQWLQCRAYRRFDAVAVVSAPLQRQLAPLVEGKRLHVVPNAYGGPLRPLTRAAARATLGLPERGFVIGWIGRLSVEKGADLLLDALGQAGAPQTARAMFIGDGPRLADLRRQAKHLRLESRVSWYGRLADADRAISAFDAFVLSSRTEGTPMVILEAMAAGVPIIATRVGGVPDVLSAGTALLVSPESPEELAAAIHDVFSDRVAAATRSRAARTRLATEYSVAAWAARYETIYSRARAHALRRLA